MEHTHDTQGSQTPPRHPRRARHIALGWLVALVAAVLALPLIGAAPAGANTPEVRDERHLIHYSGDYADLVVPEWATRMRVVAVGGTGGNTFCEAQPGWGTYFSGTIAVAAGDAVRIGVGGKGGTHSSTAGRPGDAPGGWGGNGTVGGSARAEPVFAMDSSSVAAGGGGTTIDLAGKEILVAAGGGGGGQCDYAAGGRGGAMSPGDRGHDHGPVRGGAGGDFGSETGRAGGYTVNAGGGGGGFQGDGGGKAGEIVLWNAAGGGGGGAGLPWFAGRFADRVFSTSDEVQGNDNGYGTIIFESTTNA